MIRGMPSASTLINGPEKMNVSALSPSDTFLSKLQQSDFRPSGFDYLRLTLALSVIVWHASAGIPYGMSFASELMDANPFVRVLVTFILPTFFTLSGFLVASSLERSPSLFVFLGLRVIRIVPALAVEIMLSAFVLGSIFTTYSLSSYFTHPDFFTYFFNIVGFIHYSLPGVFNTNPVPDTVNGQLWTVPYELKCYIILSIVAFLGFTKKRILMPIVCALLLTVVVSYEAVLHRHGVDVHNDLGVHGRALVLSFLLGVTLYIYSDKVNFRLGLFVVSVGAFVLLQWVPYGNIFSVVPVSYITAYIGLTNVNRIKLLLTGDYSYGIYVYHFAIQQAIVSFGPATRHWYIVLPLSAFIVVSLAAFSWFFVEKPALASRKLLLKIDARVRESITNPVRAAFARSKSS